MSRVEREIRTVVDVVRGSIALAGVDLPDEFYPSHLSVVLIDAVFRARLQEKAIAIVEQYCRTFRITQNRAERWQTPPRTEQESLGTLIAHYEDLGMKVMGDEVLSAPGWPPGSVAQESETVLHAARVLRDMGIEVLQDVAERASDEIEYALHTRAGMIESSVRRVLMYTADDAYVRGDLPVRRFVARALGVDMVSAARAQRLVRGAAHELILSPRFLDRAIWEHSASEGGVALLYREE